MATPSGAAMTSTTRNTSPAAWTPPLSAPRVHYARRGHVSLAYQLFGSGRNPLVVVPDWLWHLEQAWQEPAVAVGETVSKRQLLARGVTHVYFQANVWVFTFLVFVVGFAMGIGKAAVYRHIPDYFPRDVGVVGGLVGVIGGLGGFVCPILFGWILQRTGIWTTAWMLLALLSIWAGFLGLVGGAVVMRSLGFPFVTYVIQVESAVTVSDMIGGLCKAFVFGIVVAAIGCLRGLQTRSGASAVGQSTTRAVVSGLVLITIVDGVFAVVFYYLGI